MSIKIFSQFKNALYTALATFVVSLNSLTVNAEKFVMDNTARFEFDKIDSLFTSSIKYFQYISFAIAILVIVINGIKMQTSGDNHRGMEEAKTALIRIILAFALIFLAPYFVGLLYDAFN
jgi:hypothetical protein